MPKWACLDRCGPVFIAQARHATISDVRAPRVSKSEISASGGCSFGLDPNRLDRRQSEASSWNALFVEFYLL